MNCWSWRRLYSVGVLGLEYSARSMRNYSVRSRRAWESVKRVNSSLQPGNETKQAMKQLRAVVSGQWASGLCWTQGDDPGSHDEYIKAERWFPCQQPPADQTRPATNTWLTRQWDGCFGRKSENKAVKVSAIGKRLDLKKKFISHG